MAKKNKYTPSLSKTRPASSRNEQEQAYLVAKKVLRHFGFSPNLIDVFTKKQKQNLLQVWFEPPIVKPKFERTVPRQYVRNIHAEMHHFMRNNFWGDPENRLTYIEAVIYGASFLVNLSNLFEKGYFVSGSPQEDLAKKIYEKYDKDVLFNKIFNEILMDTWQETRGYSRINYRIYGYEFAIDHFPRVGGLSMRGTVYLTAKESEVKKFSHNNIDRKAFRVIKAASGWSKAVPATIKRNKVFPDAKEDQDLHVYVQSHVLQRLKERLDALDARYQNVFILYALTVGLEMVHFERQTLLLCSVEDGLPIGYFTFFVSGKDLVVSTFIPLISNKTPEGKKFHELLPLSKEEIVYLGMDKISFYLDVDFEQIPLLKQALIDSRIWESKLALDRLFEPDDENEGSANRINESKTKFVKNFFDKLENHSL